MKEAFYSIMIHGKLAHDLRNIKFSTSKIKLRTLYVPLDTK